MSALPDMAELAVTSSFDGSDEPALLWHPGGDRAVPLVVGLHTWSADRFNQVDKMLPLCVARRWALVLPEFRGPNLASNPRARQACGSEAARQDILDATERVTADYPIDCERVFLVGGSGGGHMALMMAGTAPEAFAAVSAWCPITDLRAWHGQNARYAPNIAACCGGVPGESDEVDEQYRLRSPMTWAAAMARAVLSVHHGRTDASVPWPHTWELVKQVQQHDPERFYFELFDGGHEIHLERAFAWFDTFFDSIRDSKLTG